jgi:hypothetical protein
MYTEIDIYTDDETLALVAEVRKPLGLVHNLPPKNKPIFNTQGRCRTPYFL